MSLIYDTWHTGLLFSLLYIFIMFLYITLYSFNSMKYIPIFLRHKQIITLKIPHSELILLFPIHFRNFLNYIWLVHLWNNQSFKSMLINLQLQWSGQCVNTWNTLTLKISKLLLLLLLPLETNWEHYSIIDFQLMYLNICVFFYVLLAVKIFFFSFTTMDLVFVC